jgi:hypothetical protein
MWRMGKKGVTQWCVGPSCHCVLIWIWGLHLGAGVEWIYWTNKSRGRHLNLKQGPDLDAPWWSCSANQQVNKAQFDASSLLEKIHECFLGRSVRETHNGIVLQLSRSPTTLANPVREVSIVERLEKVEFRGKHKGRGVFLWLNRWISQAAVVFLYK